jgi:TonB family protein
MVSPAQLLTLFLGTALAAVVLPSAQAGDPPRVGDQTFRIIQTVTPEFPRNVDTMSLTEGEARVIFTINADGELDDVLVAHYTHASFADEAVRALQAWRYEPARQYGEPIGVRASMVFYFEAKGQVVSVMGIDTMNALFASVGSKLLVRRVVDATEIDQAPAPLTTVMPRHPGRGQRNDLSAGRVVVDFYLDEEGRPRMPVILSSDDPAFSVAAVDALMTWRYSPPTRRGEPVSVRVQQAFEFPALR